MTEASAPEHSSRSSSGARALSGPRLGILAQSGSHNRLHALVSLISTVAAQGGQVQVLLTHAALNAYLERRMDDAPVGTGDPSYDEFYEQARELERIPSLHALTDAARARGGVQLFACQASVQLWRRYTPEQLSSVDAIIGHSTFLDMTRGMPLIFV